MSSNITHSVQTATNNNLPLIQIHRGRQAVLTLIGNTASIEILTFSKKSGHIERIINIGFQSLENSPFITIPQWEHIGEGVSSHVFQVKFAFSENKVAVKIAKSPEYNSSLTREHEIIRSISQISFSPNIINSLRFVLHGGRVFQFLELCSFSIKDLISSTGVDAARRSFNGLSLNKSLPIAYQIFSGLESVHRKKLIHADLKPENILVNTRGVVKIADFGISQTRINRILHNGRFLQLTATQLPYKLVQTRWYRSPEIACQSSFDERIDIWSAACSVIELLNGRPLFPSRSDEEHFLKIFLKKWKIKKNSGEIFASQRWLKDSHSGEALPINSFLRTQRLFWKCLGQKHERPSSRLVMEELQDIMRAVGTT